MQNIRRRKPSPGKPPAEDQYETTSGDDDDPKQDKEEIIESKPKKKTSEIKKKKQVKKWPCIENCCWLIGFVCVIWWLLSSLPLYMIEVMVASFFTTTVYDRGLEVINGPLPNSPGEKICKEGLHAAHPVVFIPGIVTGCLELWQGH